MLGFIFLDKLIKYPAIISSFFYECTPLQVNEGDGYNSFLRNFFKRNTDLKGSQLHTLNSW